MLSWRNRIISKVVSFLKLPVPGAHWKIRFNTFLTERDWRLMQKIPESNCFVPGTTFPFAFLLAKDWWNVGFPCKGIYSLQVCSFHSHARRRINLNSVNAFLVFRLWVMDAFRWYKTTRDTLPIIVYLNNTSTTQSTRLHALSTSNHIKTGNGIRCCYRSQ